MDTRPAPRFLTSVDVAAACGVSPRTVSNWIRDGAIAAHRTVGGHGRIAVADLRAFMTERGIPLPASLDAHGDVPAPASTGPGPQPARRRVLVIDDDEPLLSVVREVLSSYGYDVEVARHGFLAGYLAGHLRPDAIILDILMPGLDGFEILGLMRKRAEARRIPVIACTSLRGVDVETRIRAAGFDGYVRKPIDFRALAQTLEGLGR